MEVSFPSADKSFHLYGDLYLPPEKPTASGGNGSDSPSTSKRFPAIVIVAGSGPIDRNGNVGGMLTKLALNTSNRFAEYMMMKENNHSAVAVLTYDKRGVGKSLKKDDKDLYYRADMTDLVSDAVEAVRFLQSHDQIDPASIFVLGHSEGSIILPRIAQKVQDGDGRMMALLGAIFLSGFGENLFDAMKFQQANILKEVEKEEGMKGWLLRKTITKEKVEKEYSDMMDMIFDSQQDAAFISQYCGLAKIPANWFREHKTFDAKAALASEITCHCLAITGGKDLQVRYEFCEPATAKTLVPKASSIESHVIENMTHALRSMDKPPSMLSLKQDYAQQGRMPLDPELVSLVGEWLKRILNEETGE